MLICLQTCVFLNHAIDNYSQTYLTERAVKFLMHIISFACLPIFNEATGLDKTDWTFYPGEYHRPRQHWKNLKSIAVNKTFYSRTNVFCHHIIDIIFEFPNPLTFSFEFAS